MKKTNIRRNWKDWNETHVFGTWKLNLFLYGRQIFIFVPQLMCVFFFTVFVKDRNRMRANAYITKLCVFILYTVLMRIFLIILNLAIFLNWIIFRCFDERTICMSAVCAPLDHIFFSFQIHVSASIFEIPFECHHES